jgi:hypothetical protein
VISSAVLAQCLGSPRHHRGDRPPPRRAAPHQAPTCGVPSVGHRYSAGRLAAAARVGPPCIGRPPAWTVPQARCPAESCRLEAPGPSLPCAAVSPQIPHKSGSAAASPQNPHGQSGTPRHNLARMLEWPQDPLLAFMQVKRLTGSQAE